MRDARDSYRGEDGSATLGRLGRMSGHPTTMRVDRGREVVWRDMDIWACQRGVVADFSRPGTPTDNAFTDAFDGRIRAARPDRHWFLTLADAAEKLEAWRRYDNEERPRGAIDPKVLIMLTKPAGVTSPPP